MFPLISVVIPAYNSSSRIRFALESVIAQDYSNIEIILADDASQDNTSHTAREILNASGRPFRIIIHEHNKGVSSARNTGLKYSEGKYVWFMDSDDTASEKFLSSLLELSIENNADISFCGLQYVFTDGRKNIEIPPYARMPKIFTGEDIIFKRTIPVCCCLYNRDFLNGNNLCFHEGCTSGEDIEFQIKAMCRAKRVSFTQECLYSYIQHDEMGSVRDNNTQEKKIMRYEHNTEAQERTALYLMENAQTSRVKDFTEKILKPQNIIRRLNICAMKRDKKGYDSLLQDNLTASTLRKALCLNVLLQKLEVFAKAFAILHVPEIYYRLREK